MSFTDLDKKIHPSADASKPASAIQKAEREFRRVDLLLLATGLFVFTTKVLGDSFDAEVRDFASNLIVRTLVCEGYMIFLAMGALLALGKPMWLRIIILAGAVALYSLAATHDSHFSFAPLALWLLFIRLVPPGFAGLLSNDNVNRVRLITFAGLGCLSLQMVIFVMGSSLLSSFGIGTTSGHTTTMPAWYSGIVWGAYFIELAFIVPYFERNIAKFP